MHVKTDKIFNMYKNIKNPSALSVYLRDSAKNALHLRLSTIREILQSVLRYRFPVKIDSGSFNERQIDVRIIILFSYSVKHILQNPR